jgi:hypothetical protein
MLKKIIPVIVVAALLTAVQSSIAEDQFDNPRPHRRQFQTPRSGCNGGTRQLGKKFDKWLDELTKAYEDNDREKMGQLIKKMYQRRERLQEKGNTRSEFRDDFRRRGYSHRRRSGQSRGGSYGQGDFRGKNIDYGFSPERMRGRSQGYPSQSTGRRGRGFQNRDACECGRGLLYRDMDERSQQYHLPEWDW